MKVVKKHICLIVTRICTILVILGCVQTYATPSRFSELEKDAVNNSENLEFGTGKENNQGGSPQSRKYVEGSKVGYVFCKTHEIWGFPPSLDRYDLTDAEINKVEHILKIFCNSSTRNERL